MNKMDIRERFRTQFGVAPPIKTAKYLQARIIGLRARLQKLEELLSLAREYEAMRAACASNSQRAAMYKLTKSKLAVEEIGALAKEGLTFKEIADRAGVSRERIRQIWDRQIAPHLPEGQRSAADLRRQRMAIAQQMSVEDQAAEDCRLNKIRTIAEDLGMTFQPVSCESSVGRVDRRRAMINGCLCAFYYASRAVSTSPRSRRVYWRVNLTKSRLSHVAFIVIFIDTKKFPDLEFVLPGDVIQKYRGNQLYIPTDSRPAYNGAPQIDFWEYEAKWDLIEPLS